MLKKLLMVTLAIVAGGTPGVAQRKPVLPQIELPHPYYYREMYLPQLTSGPSSAAWAPDSQEVVYSMGGSLWRQRLDSKEAKQITDGAGYDYQPDWSPDGKSIVYVSYQRNAMELWLLDVASGKTWQLTNAGAVNIEARWSPDGKRIVFVSTMYNKRFHIFVGEIRDGRLGNIARLTGETKSSLPRYYYSAFDTEISPVWSRDGRDIVFVSNRGHIHGSGGFWRMRAQAGAEAREIHYEETNWKARPEFSPDGSQLVYSSYLGRNWHQLWVLPANGGDPFPISYGEWDETNVRWSPDGRKLVFVSNRNGETELWLQDFPGGGQTRLEAKERHAWQVMGKLRIHLQDAAGKLFPARISVTDQAGRFYAPRHAWIHGDDGFDIGRTPFEAHYFHTGGEEELDVPPGEINVEILHGFESLLEQHTVHVNEGATARLERTLRREEWGSHGDERWVSSDLHVHMNYGGTYRNVPTRLVEQARAENLNIVNDLVVNKEQRFPDIAYGGKELDPASREETLVMHGQEFHTSYWGHRGILGIKGHILLPGYAGYPNTAAASLGPMNADVYDLAHAQGALVGAVHPFDDLPNPFASPAEKITDELPVDVALGKLDYMEIVGFCDPRATATVWYKLLNLGFRLPAGAGTDAMMNYASLRGPVGMNRVYVRVPVGPIHMDAFFSAIRNGRTFATNGPLLDFSVGGQPIGAELKIDAPKSVPFTAKMRSLVPLDHLEVLCNGKVRQTISMNNTRDEADVTGTLPLAESGWCVLRASSDAAEYPVLDNYVYATTSPIYVTVGGKTAHSSEDARYFAAWIGRMIEVTSQYPDWNSAAQKEDVLKRLAEGKAVFEKLESLRDK